MSRTALKTYSPYILMTAAIMLPLLAPGYILTLDMVFTPELRMPDAISNDWLWHTFLHVLNVVIPSQILQKLILVSIPLLAGIGMHRLVEYIRSQSTALQKLGPAEQWAVYSAGVFYAANPFTYSRFMAGQYAVLLGYALVPFFAKALLSFIIAPSKRAIRTVVLYALVISIISIHTLGSLAIITVVCAGVALWSQRHNLNIIKQYVPLAAAGALIFILASSYWLLPLTVGQGNTAHTIQQFDASHTAAFATVGGTELARIVNVLNLHGFWLEPYGRYLIPQQEAGWGTLRLLLWIVVGGGLIVCWRRARSVAVAVGLIGLIAVVLATGVPASLLTALGYREPHKFAGLVAGVFAVALAFGGLWLLNRAKQKSESLYTLVASGLLLVVILFTPTMYWGFGRQLTPRHYPADWFTLNQRLNAEPGTFQTLFLPWHQYMSFNFAGRVIANPAQRFFDRPMLVSTDPELGHIKPDEQDKSIAQLLHRAQTGKTTDIGSELAKRNIGYVVVAKEFDYQRYTYIDDQKHLTLVWDSPTIRLYRNAAFQEGDR